MKRFATLLAGFLTSCATAAPPPPADPLSAARTADVVFFGEAHDRRAQHGYELELLKAVDAAAAGGAPVLLGMEMFQRPFQAPLDEYVAGRIDEKEMLRRTEYFTRWSFNSTFYSPLWRFARERGIRIVALNAEGSIAKKVGREGLASLTDEERAGIAADIDLANPAHRERILGIFTSGAHQMPADRLERMYEAMTLWDETMAESASQALAAAGPGARMLLVAGRGHIEEWTGIPDRLARRTPNLSRVVVLGEVADETHPEGVTKDGEQWVVTLHDPDEPPAPKLGIQFDPKPSADGLHVQSVVEGGSAAKAGIVAGDVLVAISDVETGDLTDLRSFLDTKRCGDVVTASVRRGGEILRLDVTLAPPPEPAPPK